MHGSIICDKVWEPIEMAYFCSQSYITFTTKRLCKQWIVQADSAGDGRLKSCSRRILWQLLPVMFLRSDHRRGADPGLTRQQGRARRPRLLDGPQEVPHVYAPVQVSDWCAVQEHARARDRVGRARADRAAGDRDAHRDSRHVDPRLPSASDSGSGRAAG
eukprot:2462932-Prymnesium_polylepis.1